MYNEDIAILLKEKLRHHEKIFKILQTDREKLKKSQNKVLKQILRKKLEYERRHQGIPEAQQNMEDKTEKGSAIL